MTVPSTAIPTEKTPLEKSQLLSQPVEHLDIKQHDVGPLVEAMGHTALSARDLARAADLYDRMLRDERCGIILCLRRIPAFERVIFFTNPILNRVNDLFVIGRAKSCDGLDRQLTGCFEITRVLHDGDQFGDGRFRCRAKHIQGLNRLMAHVAVSVR